MIRSRLLILNRSCVLGVMFRMKSVLSVCSATCTSGLTDGFVGTCGRKPLIGSVGRTLTGLCFCCARELEV